MITEKLLDFLFGLVDAVVGLLPTMPAPQWLTDGQGYLTQIWEAGAGLGAWIPWNLLGTVFAAVMACMLIGLGIKLVRIVASFLTVGGGSAG